MKKKKKNTFLPLNYSLSPSSSTPTLYQLMYKHKTLLLKLHCMLITNTLQVSPYNAYSSSFRLG